MLGGAEPQCLRSAGPVWSANPPHTSTGDLPQPQGGWGKAGKNPKPDLAEDAKTRPGQTSPWELWPGWESGSLLTNRGQPGRPCHPADSWHCSDVILKAGALPRTLGGPCRVARETPSSPRPRGRSSIHAFTHSLIHSFIHSHTPFSIPSVTHLLTSSLTHSLTYLLIHSATHSFFSLSYSLIHSFIHPEVSVSMCLTQKIQ